MADEDTPKKGGSGGLMAKVVAGVFAGIIAPLGVAVGLKFANKLDGPDPAPTNSMLRRDLRGSLPCPRTELANQVGTRCSRHRRKNERGEQRRGA